MDNAADRGSADGSAARLLEGRAASGPAVAPCRTAVSRRQARPPCRRRCPPLRQPRWRRRRGEAPGPCLAARCWARASVRSVRGRGTGFCCSGSAPTSRATLAGCWLRLGSGWCGAAGTAQTWSAAPHARASASLCCAAGTAQTWSAAPHARQREPWRRDSLCGVRESCDGRLAQVPLLYPALRRQSARRTTLCTCTTCKVVQFGGFGLRARVDLLGGVGGG